MPTTQPFYFSNLPLKHSFETQSGLTDRSGTRPTRGMNLAGLKKKRKEKLGVSW
jgi:hypothetical protein